jgi:phosphate-selective porin OprO/OprP
MKTYSPVATNNEYGTFNGPRIVTPFSLTGGGWGGWEIAARYSDLDLNWHPGVLGETVVATPAGGVRGGEEQIWTFGINWYLNNNIRTSFNYLSIDVNKLGTVGSLSGTSQLVQVGQHIDAFAMRLQFTN